MIIYQREPLLDCEESPDAEPLASTGAQRALSARDPGATESAAVVGVASVATESADASIAGVSGVAGITSSALSSVVVAIFAVPINLKSSLVGGMQFSSLQSIYFR